MVNTAY